MRNIIYLFLFVVMAGNAQTMMTIAEANILKAKVKSQAAYTKTILSDFTQYKHLDFLSNDIETTGKLAFKTPNLVKWEYLIPFKYAIIFKDEKLYINDEGNKSDVDISGSKQFKQLNNLIINSIKGDLFDDAEFTITYFKKDANSEVRFNPTNEKFAKFIKSFLITFSQEGKVIEVKMIEPSGDYTRILFHNRIVNNPLSDAIFAH